MRHLFLAITLLLSLTVAAQTETIGLWVGQEYTCDLHSYITSQTTDISWEIDKNHQDYFIVDPDKDVCSVKPIQYFSGTAVITCTFKVILDGVPIARPPVSWSFSCQDNPVTISPESLSLEVGTTLQPFQCFHSNETYANEAIVTYEGEGDAIEVTTDGVVRAIQPGTARVYAHSNLSKDKSAPCLVTVTDSPVQVISISLDKGSMTIEKGQTMALYATVNPSDAEYTISWSTSDPSVATVKKDSNNQHKAMVTACGKGSATITAAISGTDKKAKCSVTVTITPTSIQMPQRNYALYVGEKMTVEPVVEPEGADYSLSWKSNDPDVAIVNPSTGEVTARTVGTARITATIVGTNLSDYYNVNVDKPTLTLSATPSGGVVNKATRVKLIANDSEASIWYTLDGSAPKENTSILYDSPIAINQSVKIKAIATHPDYNNSDVLTQEYVVRTAPGDVNEDSETNIADINAIITVILDGYSNQLDFLLADVNNDDEVNIADINMVIDVILNPNNYRLDVETFVANGVEFNMIYVEGGTFTMGTNPEPNDDWDPDDWEEYEDPNEDTHPAHTVTVSSFQMGETEVTQELWEAVMGSNPSHYKGENGYGDTHDRPVENVSWYDCQEFIKKLNAITGKNFRLPTEAEWEFAARGGNKGDGHKDISGGGWFFDYDEWYAHSPSTFAEYYRPVSVGWSCNELDIYDMSGNVSEWCNDWYGSYSAHPQVNPIGPITGENRVIRGPSFEDFSQNNDDFEGIIRRYDDPTYKGWWIGLRLVLSDIEIFNVNGVQFAMIPVHGGTFTMGATSEQMDDAEDDEKPPHKVALSSYSIGQTEVTTALWNAIMPYNYGEPSEMPVEISMNITPTGVYLFDLGTFLERLNELTGREFRRPTEAEWEFAARGGNLSKGYKYAGSDNIDDVAWYSGNSGSELHKVAQKLPNELGIYDMSGNAIEVCDDYYYEYTDDYQVNPGGTESYYVPIAALYGSSLSLRGGYYGADGRWKCIDKWCRVSTRWNVCKYWYGFEFLYFEDIEFKRQPLGIRLVLTPRSIDVPH